jgi:hypothetical protein
LLFLFFLQDVTHIDGGYRPLVRVNVLDLGLSLVGFQVIMSGRFWVITEATLWAHFQGGDVDKGLAELDKQANVMIDDLLWWTAALKAARER